tara:strand:- start:7618 stop:10503 length:2886 start_codon:yes stop_codon:yes gene_type:complete
MVIYFKIKFYRKISKALISLLSFFMLSCDFQNPAAFELPTWFFDLSFPLVQQKYSLEGMVDNKQIFSTPDSLGMQLMFEGLLPKASIGSDILEVEINQSIKYAQPASNGPIFSFNLDLLLNLPVSLGLSVPSADGTVSKAEWNALASTIKVDTLIQIPENGFDISGINFPSFVESLDGFSIKADEGSSISDFVTTIKNNGMPTNITEPQILFIAGFRNLDTLAAHTQTSIAKDVTFNSSTSLSQKNLAKVNYIKISFGLASTSEENLTIKAGDSLKINTSFQIRIADVDSAIVKIREYEVPVTLPKILFPSDIEIYGGKLINPSGFLTNEINIKSLSNTYPFEIDFLMNFKNFIPPNALKDSIKIDRVLKKGELFTKVYNLDDYTFYNPAGSDNALTELDIDFSAKLSAQTGKLPLDGSNIGGIDLDLELKKLHFETLEANIIQEFPPSSFSVAGMPIGFIGLEFVDTKLEIEMLNGIRLPVVLDFDMISVNQLGDTMKVNAFSTLATPIGSTDTTKTITRLSRDGTTTLKYKSPSSVTYTDSITTSPKTGETTINDLLSSNPATFEVNSRVRIDGRGTLESGMHIGGKYRMLAPFEVIMAPMTFISVTNTPMQEMDHSNRNKIRSTMQSASMEMTVENNIPSGGELSMLMSNIGFFPLDTTVSALSAFKDSMVIKLNWASSDSLYIVSKCESLNPIIGNLFIFDVMDDFTDCIDGMAYIVKSTGLGIDTVVSYVDTLLKIPLPNPISFYTTTSSSAHSGQVKEPGFVAYSSPISTSRIRLMTNPGQPFMAPRFSLFGSNSKKVYLTTADYIDINSSINLKLSSSGMTSAAPNEITIKYPNGGETLNKDTPFTIKWKTFGTVSNVTISYYAGSNPNVESDEGWTSIAEEINNLDSFAWTPSATNGINSMTESLRDSIRIRVKSSDKKTIDMSGWYFTINHRAGKITSNSNKLKLIDWSLKP